jgi:hypothetical protein
MSIAAKTQPKLTVLNPEGYPPQVDARGMAPALETLQGKRVFTSSGRWEPPGQSSAASPNVSPGIGGV